MSRTFVDAIVPDGGRKYSLTANADGTTSIEDVTEYLQVGDRWGAAEANEIFATAESAEATAAEAKTTAAAAQTTADGKISKSGDTMTGNLNFNTSRGVLFSDLAGGTFRLMVGEDGDLHLTHHSANGEWIDTPFHITKEGNLNINGYSNRYAGGTMTGDLGITASHGLVLLAPQGQDSQVAIRGGSTGNFYILGESKDGTDGTILIGFNPSSGSVSGLLMPKSGGQFTGDVSVPQRARNGWYVYNSAVYASGGTSTVSSVDLRFIRK